MIRGKRILGLALAGGILWSSAANATSICPLDLMAAPDPEFTNTGVCGQVITTLGGFVVQDLDESASVASASAQQGTNPPPDGNDDNDGTSGTGIATYPDLHGTGGSVGAAAYVAGGGGTSGEISSLSGSFFIGEFIANDGDPDSNNPFDLTVNLGITGDLFVQNDGTADLVAAFLTIAFVAVDENEAVLGQFTGTASVFNLGGILLFDTGALAFTAPFTPSDNCSVFSPDCTLTANTTESVILADLVDNDVFGLFLSILATAVLVGGEVGGVAHSNFANTVDISFQGEGGTVTAVPANFAIPEPASIALVLAGVLAIGFARRRRAY